ncbi:uncharacterized protein [Dermacentor albipictus]|uniref:uncharacterized protein n=1 Tax=Dermacentor albipictus TaxID=60249 RepID=UPI0038FC5FB5
MNQNPRLLTCSSLCTSRILQIPRLLELLLLVATVLSNMCTDKCIASTLQMSVQSSNPSPPGEHSPSPQMERTKEESASLQLGDKFFPSPLEEPEGYRASACSC